METTSGGPEPTHTPPPGPAGVVCVKTGEPSASSDETFVHCTFAHGGVKVQPPTMSWSFEVSTGIPFTSAAGGPAGTAVTLPPCGQVIDIPLWSKKPGMPIPYFGTTKVPLLITTEVPVSRIDASPGPQDSSIPVSFIFTYGPDGPWICSWIPPVGPGCWVISR